MAESIRNDGRTRTMSRLLRLGAAMLGFGALLSIGAGGLGGVGLPALSSSPAEAATSCSPSTYGCVLLAGSAWAPSNVSQYFPNLNVISNGSSYTGAYQCTELALRWAQDAWGEPRSWPNWDGSAADMWTAASHLPNPLQWLPNGSSQGPQPGDLLLFKDKGPGHVAIVTSVANGVVNFVGQNQYPYGATASVPISSGNVVHVGNFYAASANASVEGWLHNPSWKWNSTVVTNPAARAGFFSGSGKADLIAVNGSSTFVMPSTGSSFSAPQGWSSTPFYGTKATLVGDVTGDKKDDLIAINASSTWVMPSTGSGFLAPQQWSSTPFYGNVATLVGDVNGDGRADLIAVNSNSTWVMLSTGSGFSAPQQWSSTPFYGTKATLVGDATGDGKADLIAVNASGTFVMPSTGSSFSAPQGWSSTPFYGNVATLVGDASGDGKADLIAVNTSGTFVMPSTGSGFSAPQQWSSTPFYGTKATLVGDATGDGKADLIAVNASSTFVMPSTGSSFSAPQGWSSTPFYGTE